MTVGWSLPAKLSANDYVTVKKETTIHTMHETVLRNVTIFSEKLFYIEQIKVEYYRNCYVIVKGFIQKKLHSKTTRFPRKGL